MTLTSPHAPSGHLHPSAADRLLHQRIIVLGQPVDDDIANRLVAELLLLSAEDPVRDISLHLDSPGGSVTAVLAVSRVVLHQPSGAG